MKFINRRATTAAACSIAVLLGACGGSGTEGYNQQNQPDLGAASQTTAELDVPTLFDWSSDKQIKLSLALHDVSGDVAANTRVSVYDMPQSAVDDDREPNDFELQQVAEIFSGYTDNEGRINTTVNVSAHALSTEHVYVKTKLIGVAATAVVPVDETSAEGAQATWVFGPAGVATEIVDPVNPSELTGEPVFDFQSRSAATAGYFLEPFNQNYHWYYGHLPRSQWGTVCNVETDTAGTQCRSSLYKTQFIKLAEIIQEGTKPAEKYLNASQEQRSLVFNKKAKVTVSFLQESAGYRNTLGFFKYNSAAVPTDEASLDSATILFPNTSYRGSGGYMQSGDSVSLGEIDPAGGEDSIGFYLNANGWLYNRGQGTNGQRFYSLDALNPENDKTDAKHMLLIANDEIDTASNTRRLWLAVEDIRFDTGESDRDYNDLIVQLDIYPADALVNANLIPDLSEQDNTVADADNDGVLVADDVDDNDPKRAFVRYYPAEKGWATLLAEDNWPVLGDFDMNDMVVRYKVKEVFDSKKRVKDISIKYILEARGAAFHNGFAVSFGDNAFADNVESALLNSASITPMADPSKLAFQIFDDAWTYAERGEAGCWTFNTVSECANRDASEFSLELTFENAVELSDIGQPPYNPFLTAHKTAQGTAGYTRFDSDNTALYTESGEVKDFEIHMPNHQPTQGQDVSMFGTGDDASNGVDRFYVSNNNLPWVLNVPYQIYYPEEYVDIGMAYPEFPEWVASGGSAHRDWYLAPADKFFLYDASTTSADADDESQTSGPASENLSLKATSNGRSLQRGSSYANVHDSDVDTIWTPAYNGGRASLKWRDGPEKMNTVVIKEAAGYEGAVRDWRLVDQSTGYEFARGTGLNSSAPGVALIKFETREVRKLSFVIDNTNDNAKFAISEFETYLE